MCFCFMILVTLDQPLWLIIATVIKLVVELGGVCIWCCEESRISNSDLSSGGAFS